MSAPAQEADLAPSGAVKSAEERRSELRRMRTIATSLLVAMTVIFIAMRHAPANWAFAPYVGAFAEAGMVGACADWFAVVALFRHPLGLPIPHTAVVAANKNRIGAALGRFITNNFLSPRVAAARLRSVDVVGLTADWLADPRNAELISAAIGRLAPHAVAALPDEAMADWIGGVARKGVEALPVAPLASRALGLLWANGAGQTLLDQGLDFMDDVVARNRETVVQQVRHQTSTWIPRWVDEIIADKVLQGLASTLNDMRRPDHLWREQADQRVKQLVDALAHDPAMREKGEALKRELLDNPAFAEQSSRTVEGSGSIVKGGPAAARRGDRRLGAGRARVFRSLDRGRAGQTGAHQPRHPPLRPADRAPATRRGRRLHRRGRRPMGHEDARQPARAAGR